jgi:hypothetical protein
MGCGVASGRFGGLFPVSVSLTPSRRMGNRNRVVGCGVGQVVPFGRANEDAFVYHPMEGGAESGSPHAAEATKGMERQRALLSQECLTDAFRGGKHGGFVRRQRCLRIQDGEGGVRAFIGQVKGDVVLRRSGAVLGGEGEPFADAAEIEIGIAPSVEVAGAA